VEKRPEAVSVIQKLKMGLYSQSLYLGTKHKHIFKGIYMQFWHLIITEIINMFHPKLCLIDHTIPGCSNEESVLILLF
jgi:hypothetical protein